MPIVSVTRSGWTDRKDKVEDFLIDLASCISRMQEGEHKARAQGMYAWVMERRAFSDKQRWWLDSLLDREQVSDSDREEDFWNGILGKE